MSQADWRSLYPFASHFALRNGARYHYLDEGTGKPVLLVHGNPTWSFTWRNLILALRDNARCIAVDHLGCGLSDKPRPYEYTLAQHTANLVSLIDQLDLQNVTLVAHDWGGAIGLGAVLQRRHRFRRLVLLNTGAFPPPYVPWRIAACRIPFLGQLAIQGFNLFARAALTMATERPERFPPAVQAGYLAPYDTWAHRTAVWHFVRDIPFTEVHPTWHVLADLERRLPELQELPAALLWGMRDWCFNAVCLEKLATLLPQAEVHRFPQAGHYVMEDALEQIVPLLRKWLADAGDSRA
jgi:haloalkane dehalogenase